ncbi:hypothetical protein JXJ21_11965 [candidate division KSB1 bacterium]|nr:hypothetical protein [candidate division KSB1 bacterium]
MRSHIIKIHIAITLFFIVALMHFAPCSARDNPLVSVEPRIQSERLAAIGHFTQLIDAEMKETLASGMSNTLNFYLKLVDADSKEIIRRGESVALRYNVWEKIYYLRNAGTEARFMQFTSFEAFINDSLTFNLGSIKLFPPDRELRIIFTFSPKKLSDTQKSKLNSWLISGGDIDQSKPARESESTFSINLSRLISMFFSNKERNEIYLQTSKPFTIRSLMHENASR